MEKFCAGIELGGTKIICALGSFGKISKKVIFSTASPDKNIKELAEFLKKEKIEAVGIGSFGPVVIDPKDPNFGLITNTTKADWANVNIIRSLEALNLPLFLDTDVGAAALGELLFGSGRNLSNLVYWTIGTGIGAGVIIGKEIFHGLVNTEMGHWLVPHDKNDLFPGVCPVHMDCLEGLASGTSLKKRWDQKIATDLEENHKGWELEAKYLSIAMINTILSFSPERIVLGGGVMKNKSLYPKVRKLTKDFCSKFFENPNLQDMESYIVPPLMGDDSGILGALALACKGLEKK